VSLSDFKEEYLLILVMLLALIPLVMAFVANMKIAAIVLTKKEADLNGRFSNAPKFVSSMRKS
jgi:hypothetical protein